ncbi:MAG: hypothetical protein ACRDO9_01255, partial [Gaiellales bacterium]
CAMMSRWRAHGRGRLRSIAILGLMLASLAGCTSDGGDPTGATGSTGGGTIGSVTPEAIPLEVFVYNVEYGGD